MSKDPIFQASAVFGIAIAAGFASFTTITHHHYLGSIVFEAITLVATLLGVLVLGRSAAINRITLLQRRSKSLQDELARIDLYFEQTAAALTAATSLYHGCSREEHAVMIQGVIDALAMRVSAVFRFPPRIYVANSTSQSHTVVFVAGDDPFGLGPGKQCPADRPLEEVVRRLGEDWALAPFVLNGSEHFLILLAEEHLMPADRLLIEQVAQVFTLTDKGAVKTMPRLHAVG